MGQHDVSCFVNKNRNIVIIFYKDYFYAFFVKQPETCRITSCGHST